MRNLAEVDTVAKVADAYYAMVSVLCPWSLHVLPVTHAMPSTERPEILRPEILDVTRWELEVCEYANL